MESTNSTKKSSIQKFSYKKPLLFTIPLDVYSDELEKVRDKQGFHKIAELEKKLLQLRQKLHSYSKENLERIKLTQYLAQRTIDVSSNLIARKS